MTTPIDVISILIDKYTDKLAEQRRDYEARIQDWRGNCDTLTAQLAEARKNAKWQTRCEKQQAEHDAELERLEKIHEMALAACRERADEIASERDTFKAQSWRYTKELEATRALRCAWSIYRGDELGLCLKLATARAVGAGVPVCDIHARGQKCKPLTQMEPGEVIHLPKDET